MTTAITKESLAARIADLEYGARSLKEDYTLAAYKMLLAAMEAEPVADVVSWSHPNEERKCDIRWRRHDIEPGPLYRHAQPEQIAPGWIPVSERMPDENEEQQILACFKGGDISTLYYFEGRWDDAYGIVPIRQDVTHWMPLPAVPAK